VTDRGQAAGRLVGTSEPSPHLHDRLMEHVAYRSPWLARAGARAVEKLTRRELN